MIKVSIESRVKAPSDIICLDLTVLAILVLTLNLRVSSADNFANSLDPDQARRSVGPDQDSSCLTL